MDKKIKTFLIIFTLAVILAVAWFMFKKPWAGLSSEDKGLFVFSFTASVLAACLITLIPLTNNVKIRLTGGLITFATFTILGIASYMSGFQEGMMILLVMLIAGLAAGAEVWLIRNKPEFAPRNYLK